MPAGCAGGGARPANAGAASTDLVVQLENGMLRPRACFDGTPLRPTRQASAGIVFDCAWKPGSVQVPAAESFYVANGEGCAVDTASGATASTQYEMAPFVERFDFTRLAAALGVGPERICVPSRCIYDTPGEPATCSDDCAADFTTRYLVDRARCTSADLLRVAPGIDTAFAVPTRCTDSKRPGLRAIGDKWRPCACFDGSPVVPSGPSNLSVPFDCSWPEGKILVKNVHESAFRPSDASCHGLQSDGQNPQPGFVETPFIERYEAGEGDPLNGLAQHELCVPSSCVFDQPGAPARCSEDCSPQGTTRYTANRRACH
jgi:hypothetical protein